jgi:hypothetical protein
MNVFKIYILTGILLVIAILIYEFYLPVGKSYQNAFEILASNVTQYNIPNLKNSSLFVIDPQNSTIIFYKNYYNLILSPLMNNVKSFELTPKNKTDYSIIIGNKTCYSILLNKNISFYYNPITNNLEFYCFNNLVNNYAFESFNENISSFSSSNKSQISVFYNQKYSTKKTNLYYNNSVNFYKPFKITCTSNSTYLLLFDNYGNKTESTNGTATLNILAYPELSITCYDGQELLTKYINFTKIVPILNLTHFNNTIYCNSTVISTIYLYVNNKTIEGFGSVSYKGNTSIKGNVVCEQPGNNYQEAAKKSINIA